MTRLGEGTRRAGPGGCEGTVVGAVRKWIGLSDWLGG